MTTINNFPEQTTILSDDKFLLQTAAGVTKSAKFSNMLSGGSGGSNAQDFRLTLASAIAVSTSDVTAATTIYCTPYKGNKISLYDGTNWNTRSSAQFSLALGTLTSGKPYDVFCYDNAGTPTLEFLAWTNDTTRATALAYQDGILVKSGAATRRYLGTFYTTSATTTEDSTANRYLWNYYNRVSRAMQRLETAVTWTYTTASFRQANGNSANQLNFVIGVSEETVSAELLVRVSNSNTNVQFVGGIGLDSTTSEATSGYLRGEQYTQASNVNLTQKASLNALIPAGRHYLAWLEYSQASGSSTWVGNSQFGMLGNLRA